ncbi:hypothetical protein BO70DRAFT_135422 [Aspergillus heteromorphus CBS 117.55]|uniref:Uncharacterized protein n=1 Tax=Aspergillus heteromorphus CBS 117.55 TaxID=1448321 RepID=A0A317WZL6_9EURO|nr:uncharacterized protein BO70DRAFT_135422 [Aspergillus heteromorphus CBS 117.55]PWY90168.1 hypothetical protein BO70DRAFT_135422 [Aspergillus heteromorphus CBS 117.55]
MIPVSLASLLTRTRVSVEVTRRVGILPPVPVFGVTTSHLVRGPATTRTSDAPLAPSLHLPRLQTQSRYASPALMQEPRDLTSARPRPGSWQSGRFPRKSGSQRHPEIKGGAEQAAQACPLAEWAGSAPPVWWGMGGGC